MNSFITLTISPSRTPVKINVNRIVWYSPSTVGGHTTCIQFNDTNQLLYVVESFDEVTHLIGNLTPNNIEI